MARFHVGLHNPPRCVEIEADIVELRGEVVLALGPPQAQGGRFVVGMFRLGDLAHVFDTSKGKLVPGELVGAPPPPPKEPVYGHGAPPGGKTVAQARSEK